MRPHHLDTGEIAGAAWRQCTHNRRHCCRESDAQRIGGLGNDFDKLSRYVLLGHGVRPLIEHVHASGNEHHIPECVDAQRRNSGVGACADVLHAPPRSENACTGRSRSESATATEHDIDTAVVSLVQQGAGALMVANDPFFVSRRDQIVALAARHTIPTMYFSREFTAAGGLLSYGASLIDATRQGGIYTGKILKG